MSEAQNRLYLISHLLFFAQEFKIGPKEMSVVYISPEELWLQKLMYAKILGY